MLLEVVSQLSLFSIHYFWLSRGGFSIMIVFHALLLVTKIGFIYVIIMIIWILYDLLSLYVCLYGVLTYESLVARNYFICKIWRFKNLIRTILLFYIILIYIVLIQFFEIYVLSLVGGEKISTSGIASFAHNPCNMEHTLG